MNEITIEYLQERLSQRYFDRLPHKTLSKKELIERLKTIDYEQLTEVMKEEVSDQKVIAHYSNITSMNNPEISAEAINYIFYKLNDNKYEAMSSLFGNDLAKI